MQDTYHLCLTSSLWGWIILEHREGGPWKVNELFWTPILSKDIFYRICPNRHPSRPESALQNTRIIILIFDFFSPSHDPELQQLLYTAAKAAPELHIPILFFLACRNKAQSSVSPHEVPSQLCSGVIIAFQKPPALLVSCCTIPRADIVVVKTLHKEQGWQKWGFFHSSKGLIFCFLHQAACSRYPPWFHPTGLPSNPGPETRAGTAPSPSQPIVFTTPCPTTYP